MEIRYHWKKPGPLRRNSSQRSAAFQVILSSGSGPAPSFLILPEKPPMAAWIKSSSRDPLAMRYQVPAGVEASILSSALDHWIVRSLDRWIAGSLDRWIVGSPILGTAC